MILKFREIQGCFENLFRKAFFSFHGREFFFFFFKVVVIKGANIFLFVVLDTYSLNKDENVYFLSGIRKIPSSREDKNDGGKLFIKLIKESFYSKKIDQLKYATMLKRL